MTTLAAALRFQLRLLRRSPDQLLALVTAPMMTLIFLAISRHAGRADLAPYAVLAPALIALWGMALLTAGEIVAGERDNGSLELLIATPAAFPGVIVGRIAGVAAVSLAGFAESWLAAGLVFRVVVPVPHPAVFAATLAVTLFSTAGTASMMSAVFVLARSARTFQNSLSYPFYVLGGVLVPVALLPDWLRPATRAVFLSWSSDLLRDALAHAGVRHLPPRLAAVAALGLLGYAAGVLLLRRAVNRARTTGSVGHA
jgi:ABC-2 type transport system permease protein